MITRHSWPRALALFLLLMVACTKAHGGGVVLDAKDVPLPNLVQLLDAQGGPTLTVHPDLQGEKVTFAAKAMSPAAALRWLCRVNNLVVDDSKEGRLVLARPAAKQSVDREYNVAKLVTTQEATDGLVSFIKKAIFELHPIRAKGEQGELEPPYEAVCEKGKLKVCGPPAVHREVVALLRAMTKVEPKRGSEDVRVTYQSYEVGFLGPRNSSPGPKLLGEVSVHVADAKPAEAAWALTSAAKVSFYVDPWDPGLQATKVSLDAEKRPLAQVADDLAQQLNAERCWYDEAWLFVSKERRPIFESLMVRAYNVSVPWGGRWGEGRALRELMRLPQQLQRNLPFAVERFDDFLLVCGPPEWHQPVEALLKAADDFRPPTHHRAPGGRGPKGK